MKLIRILLALALIIILALGNVESRRIISNKKVLKNDHIHTLSKIGDECRSEDKETEGLCAATDDCLEPKRIPVLHEAYKCEAGEVCCEVGAESSEHALHIGIETNIWDFDELFHCNLMFHKYLTSKNIEVTFYDQATNGGEGYKDVNYGNEDIIIINSHGSSNGLLIGNKFVNWYFKSNTYKAAIKYWVFACFIKSDSLCFRDKGMLVGKELKGFFPGLIINPCYKAGQPGFLLSNPSSAAGYVEAFKAAYGKINPTEFNLWKLPFVPGWKTSGPLEMDVTTLETLLEQYENKAGSSFISLDDIFGDELKL